MFKIPTLYREITFLSQNNEITQNADTKAWNSELS